MKKKYIFRNEGLRALVELRKNTNTLAKKFDSQYLEALNLFLKDLSTAILESTPTDVEIVIHELESLEKEKKKLLGTSDIISMDSYNSFTNAIMLGVSRAFAKGGIKQIEVGMRPGYPTLQYQISRIGTQYKNKIFTLIDDDIFSGGTVRNIINLLNSHGISIDKIVVGVQVSEPQDIEIPIESVFKFKADDVFELNDPRDFLMGSYEAGLVIKSGNNLVRVPYILPFVDVTKRAGILKDKSLQFSNKILDANERFYQKVEEIADKPILLSDLGKHFQLFAMEQFKIKNDISIYKVLSLYRSLL